LKSKIVFGKRLVKKNQLFLFAIFISWQSYRLILIFHKRLVNNSKQYFIIPLSTKKYQIKYLICEGSAKIDAWTAGKESRCAGKFEWCSTKLFFPLRKDLVWKKEPAGGSCVSIDFNPVAGQFESPLRKADCSEKKNIICEVYKLQL